jgi:hypothetical protein
MRDSDIDTLSADGAQGSSESYGKAIPSRAQALAALAEAMRTSQREVERVAVHLAERGVLLMGDSEWERVGLLISDALDYTNDGAVIAKAVRAALSARVTE